VSWKLVREVLAGAPHGLTAGEWKVLVVVAERANDETRQCYPGLPLLADETNLSEDGVTKALQRLAARGLELRVPVLDDAGQPRRDRRGRLVYAYPGHQTTYRLPELAERNEHKRLREESAARRKAGLRSTQMAGQVSTQNSGMGGRESPEWVDDEDRNGWTGVHPYPSVQPSVQPPQGGAIDEESMTRLVDAVRAVRPVWSERSIRDAAANAAEQRQMPLDQVAAALVNVARRTDTAAPGRVLIDGPWWPGPPTPTPPRVADQPEHRPLPPDPERDRLGLAGVRAEWARARAERRRGSDGSELLTGDDEREGDRRGA